MKNFSFKILGEAGVRLLSVLFILLFARKVGAANFGRYSSAFAFASMFMILVDLGTNSIVTREIARNPREHRQIIGSTNLLKLLASVLAFCAIRAATIFNHLDGEQARMIDALGIVTISYTLTDYFSALLSGKEEMGWEAILKVSCRGLIVTFGVATLYLHGSLLNVVGAMGWGALLSLVLGSVFVGIRFGAFGFSFSRVWLKKLLLSSFPLFGSVIFWLFYDNQDILLLNYFHIPNEQIGLFSSAIKVIDVLKVLPVLLTGVFFPALSRLSLGAVSSFIHQARSLIALTLCSFPVVVGAMYIATPKLILLLYGPGFDGAAPLLRILLPAYVGISLNHIALHLLIAKNRERDLFGAAAVACLTNLAASVLLIPRYGVPGVCYALLASEFLYLLFQVRLVSRSVPGLFAMRISA